MMTIFEYLHPRLFWRSFSLAGIAMDTGWHNIMLGIPAALLRWNNMFMGKSKFNFRLRGTAVGTTSIKVGKNYLPFGLGERVGQIANAGFSALIFVVNSFWMIGAISLLALFYLFRVVFIPLNIGGVISFDIILTPTIRALNTILGILFPIIQFPLSFAFIVAIFTKTTMTVYGFLVSIEFRNWLRIFADLTTLRGILSHGFATPIAEGQQRREPRGWQFCFNNYTSIAEVIPCH